MKRFLSLLSAILIILSSGIAYAEAARDLSKEELEKLINAYKIIQEEYPFELAPSKLFDGAMKGLFNTVDDYSEYFNPEETKAFYEETDGKFVGIGVYISQVENTGLIKIEGVIPGTPAEKAKLQPGDIITEIAGKNLKDMEFKITAKLMRGEPGKKVKLKYLRDNTSKIIEILRKEIEINPVETEIIDGIAYIKFKEFTTGSAGKLKKVLDELSAQGIDRMILDLRNNPGGLMSEAIDIGKFLIPRGKIVSVRTTKGIEQTFYSFIDKPEFKYCVLVNGFSASASEIIAGAVKDKKAGTIIGENTFGKGIIQKFVPLHDGSAFKYTYAEYLTPKGKSIHKIGVKPDIEIKNEIDEKGNIKDLQLQKAVEVLKK